MSGPLPPGLHIVATPIGNLGDLSPRAAETLERADRILAEDTRVTGKLLAHAGVKTPMLRYDDHSSDADRDRIVAMLGEQAIALVSDAGTPLISDPGYKLVRAARAAGHTVHTVPGPSAVIAALTLAGLPTDRFLFVGFLPAKAKARSDAIAEIAGVRATLALYETGPRLGDTLAALGRGSRRPRSSGRARADQAPRGMRDRPPRPSLPFATPMRRPKGEIVIVVGPPAEAAVASDADVDARSMQRSSACRRRAPRRRSPSSSTSRASAPTPARSSARGEPAGSRAARPRRGDARLLVFAAEGLAHPRAARPRARRRSRYRGAARAHARLRRGQGARERGGSRLLARPVAAAPRRGGGGAPFAAVRAAGRRFADRRDVHRVRPLAEAPDQRLARMTKPRLTPYATAMPLRVAVQMDPLESINISGDSTFALMLAAQERGHTLYHYLPQDLTLQDGRLYAGAHEVTVQRVAGDHFRLGAFAI